MAIKKAYPITDLGGGDGGKGNVVQKVCAMRHPHTVIKVGGAQGSHGVPTPYGGIFSFSQFGCGTFDGAKTFISDRFVVSPIGILNEAHALHYELGISDPMSLMTIAGRALCTTPYHGIASRLKELARKDNPRGIVGVGVGEAYLDAKQFPELAIYAADLGHRDLLEKLRAVRAQKHQELASVLEAGFMAGDMKEVQRQIDLIRDEGFLLWSFEQFRELAKRARIVDGDFLRKNILAQDGVVVIESSHGVLTDRYYGFHPHTSRFRTLPEITSWSLLRENGYDGEVVKIGVTRAYQIRHGAGPLVTDDPKMAEELLAHEVSAPDRYRGKVRVGPLDSVMLRYALNVCGGSNAFDALAVTWFDSAVRRGFWQVCDHYEGATDPSLFSPAGEILVHHGEDDEQLRHQGRLTEALLGCCPCLSTFPLQSGSTRKEAIDLCNGVLTEKLGVPVRMISFGPMESDKVCF